MRSRPPERSPLPGKPPYRDGAQATARSEQHRDPPLPQLRPGRQAQILQGAREFTPVMASHLRTSELHRRGLSFAAFMQGDFALQKPPAEIRLRRLRNRVIQEKP